MLRLNVEVNRNVIPFSVVVIGKIADYNAQRTDRIKRLKLRDKILTEQSIGGRLVVTYNAQELLFRIRE